MDNSKSKNIRFIVAIILMVVLGTASGLACARFEAKNSLSLQGDLVVKLKEDVTFFNNEKAIDAILDSSEKIDSNDYMEFIPAGSTGYTHLDIWYYSKLDVDVSDFSIGSTFRNADGESVKVLFSNSPEMLEYDNCVDLNKLESPESVIADYKGIIDSYKKLWRNNLIKGAVIGLIISGIAAAVFGLIYKIVKKPFAASLLFGIVTGIDILLLINTLALLYLFTRLL